MTAPTVKTFLIENLSRIYPIKGEYNPAVKIMTETVREIRNLLAENSSWIKLKKTAYA